MTQHDGTNHDGPDPAAGGHDAGAALRAAFAEIQVPAEARARHLHTVRYEAASLPVPSPRSSGSPSSGPWQRLRLRVAATATTAALALGGGAGAALAAEQALPGDALYPAKLALEQASLRLPTDVATQAQRSLALAERRLAEAEQLGDPAGPLVAATIERHRLRLDEAGVLAAGDPDLEARVAAAASQAVQRLTELLDGELPEQAAEQAREALERARDRIEQREDRATTPPRGQDATPRDSIRPPADRGSQDRRPDEPGRAGEAQQRSEDRGRVDRPDTDARPRAGFPPPSPGTRAPRGPRS